MVAKANVADQRVPGYLGRVLDEEGTPCGTCFHVAPGVLVTAWHVLDEIGAGALESLVRMDSLRDGHSFTAMVARTDPGRDLAILTSDACQLTVAGLLTATDRMRLRAEVTVTGHSVPDDPGHSYRFLDAPGEWAGGATRDNAVKLGRMTSIAVVRGMSGAPVIRASDSAVAGVVSGRYNSADGWLAGTVWVARTEDLVLMLEGIADVPMRRESLPVTRRGRRPVLLGNLPPRDPDFTGREAMLAAVGRKLAEAGTVAVHGLGGTGKSQLALAFAQQGRTVGTFDITWWVRAESATSIVEDLTGLGRALKIPVGEDQVQAVTTVQHALRQRDRWLLVFDNAANARAVQPWLPSGEGQVLITSRDRSWVGVAQQVELGCFARSESLAYLRRRSGREEPAADTLAEVLGDLPLALAQVASYTESHGGLSAARYLRLYREREGAGLLLAEGTAGYPSSVATTWLTHFDQLARSSPAALQLLRLCSHLDPDEIDIDLLLRKPEVLAMPLTAQLADAAARPVAREQAVGVLTATGLVNRIDDYRISLHRLVSQVTRHELTQAGTDLDRRWARHAISIVADAADLPTTDHGTWNPPDGVLRHAVRCADLISAYGIMDKRGVTLLLHVGEYLTKRSRFSEAEPILELALTACEQAESSVTDTAQSLRLLATLYRDRGDYPEAELLYLRALETCETEPAGPTLALAQTLRDLGWLYRKHGRYIAAEPLFRRALTIQESLLGPSSGTAAHTLNDLGCLTEEMGKYAEAEKMYLDALEIRERIFGLEHPDTATSLWDLGWVYRRMGNYAKAEEFFSKALTIRRGLFGEEDMETAMNSCDLAWIYIRTGRHADARILLEQSLSTRLMIVGEDHPDTAMSLHELAYLAETETAYDTASELYGRALAVRERRLGQDHPDIAATIGGLARLYASRGDHVQAKKLYARSIAIHERLPDITHPDFPLLLFGLARVYESDGDGATAMTLLKRSIAAARSLQLDDTHPDFAPVLEFYRNVAKDVGDVADTGDER